MMLLATGIFGDRIAATPGSKAHCPLCAHAVLAKCGSLIVWHWAHYRRHECDPWAEPDTAWHLDWQAKVPLDRREVLISPHRADIVTPDGTVVELQTKALPVHQVAAREAFYRRMVWIFDVRDPVASGRLSLRCRDGYWSFRWEHPRKSVVLPHKPVFLDCGKDVGVLRLRRIHIDPTCGGWGDLWSHDDIDSALNRRKLKDAS